MYTQEQSFDGPTHIGKFSYSRYGTYPVKDKLLQSADLSISHYIGSVHHHYAYPAQGLSSRESANQISISDQLEASDPQFELDHLMLLWISEFTGRQVESANVKRKDFKLKIFWPRSPDCSCSHGALVRDPLRTRAQEPGHRFWER